MRLLIIILCCSAWIGCNPPSPEAFPLPSAPEANPFTFPDIDRSTYYDKVLGFLVGSAIGDAMGSPVEMWSQDAIKERYGLVDNLIPNARISSAEGPWGSNLPAGSGTDDTRWKYALAQYVLSAGVDQINSQSFALFVKEQFQSLQSQISDQGGLSANQLESQIKFLQWLQEWSIVSEAYLTGDINTYNDKLAKFYGGEMSCAGMLYAPMLGLLKPGNPIAAYQSAWDLSIFDIGYAKDLSSLTAALVSQAIIDTSIINLLNIHISTDPNKYADSRLIGRMAHGIHEAAILSGQQKEEFAYPPELPLPDYFVQDSAKYLSMLSMYENMQSQLQSIPFHAHEIYLITLYALSFSKGNFKDALIFVTNFGRDNDTVGAIVGGVLGARNGYQSLPSEWAIRTIQVHRDVLNIDLEQIAQQWVEKIYPES